MVTFLLSQFRYKIFIRAEVKLFYNTREQKLAFAACIYKDTFVLITCFLRRILSPCCQIEPAPGAESATRGRYQTPRKS